VATPFFRLRTLRFSAVPGSGPCIIVCNHQSYLDPVLIGLAMRGRAIHPIARLGLFKNPFFAWLIRALNAIPIRENTGDRAAIRAGLGRLAEGSVVLVFPEGSRTPDGSVQAFKRGALLMIGQSRCPVLPAAIEGAFEAWPRTRRFPRLWGQRVAVAFGRPIDHDELLADGPNAALQRLHDEVEGLRGELRGLLGKE
jgi:1-acyl-sn-glycerol-3-phosphate acyltransferase